MSREKLLLILLGVSVITTVIYYFLYRSAAIDLKFFMNAAANRRYGNDPMIYSDPSLQMSVVNSENDTYKMRLAELQDQVIEGCKIINDQKVMINNLRTLLQQSQARNKKQKTRK
jgi:hypothetical protein